MAIRDLVLAQTTTSIVNTSVEEGSTAALVEETLVVHPTLEVATTQDSARTLISKVPVVISEMRELLIQLAPALIGVTSALPLSSESALTAIVETGSISAPDNLTPVVDILEGLVIHMIDQFFSMMILH